MTRALRPDEDHLDRIHRDREQLNAERRQLQAVFDSMMAERRALLESLRHIAEATRRRQRSGTD